jgi:hypothetical protein
LPFVCSTANPEEMTADLFLYFIRSSSFGCKIKPSEWIITGKVCMKKTLEGRKHGWLKIVGALTASLFCLFAALAVIPAVSPSTGALVADALRSALGPQPVANIESVSFWIQDNINQFLSSQNGGKVQIALNQTGVQSSDPAGTVDSSFSSQNNTSDPLLENAVTALPHIGWQAYGAPVDGQPAMAQTLQTLDPKRPYAGIALVRVDLSKLQLHMMPGFLEPSHTAEIQHAFPNLGLIPSADQARLFAAFNGGFKAVNGHYGMMVNGITLLPPSSGLATIVIYRDGHVNIGAWGRDILPSSDILAYRENCPLILQNGQLNPEVSVDDRMVWGQTIGNKEVTWRTAIGLTRDGRYLIYAVGNGSTLESLAQALQKAGAYNAMQLDINRHYAHFVTYQSTGKANAPLAAVQLLSQMEPDPTIYTVAHSRDFFYLTTP